MNAFASSSLLKNFGAHGPFPRHLLVHGLHLSRVEVTSLVRRALSASRRLASVNWTISSLSRATPRAPSHAPRARSGGCRSGGRGPACSLSSHRGASSAVSAIAPCASCVAAKASERSCSVTTRSSICAIGRFAFCSEKMEVRTVPLGPWMTAVTSASASGEIASEGQDPGGIHRGVFLRPGRLQALRRLARRYVPLTAGPACANSASGEATLRPEASRRRRSGPCGRRAPARCRRGRHRRRTRPRRRGGTSWPTQNHLFFRRSFSIAVNCTAGADWAVAVPWNSWTVPART